MALLLNYLTQRETEQSESELFDEDDIDLDLPQSMRESEKAQAQEERVKAFNHLRQTVNDMYAELEEMRARNDDLAAALGACYLCWGEDSRCKICGGNGHPGSFEIDKELFAEFVIPAVYRQKQESMARRSSRNTRTRTYSNYEP
ncbi:hypothetical protein IQ276_007320 [Desmonostoc muscorum LEGE 12446]|nr:hypothetical protein [Desmonostoc muscorum]MCF2146264.1 hypothetical protein [Desmonostoc muscorum LEGE 12446]